MSTYTPDKWVVVKIEDETSFSYRVLGGWLGGFSSGDSWKLSSGIIRVVDNGGHWEFHNFSGSIYICYKVAHGTSVYSQTIYNRLESGANDKTTILMLEKDTDYSRIVYE